jgi:hypothetical protein
MDIIMDTMRYKIHKSFTINSESIVYPSGGRMLVQISEEGDFFAISIEFRDFTNHSHLI